MRTVAGALAVVLCGAAPAAPAPGTADMLDVRVTRDGRGVASAVVCVGTQANRAVHGQKLTDGLGHVRFALPPLPFVVTAGASGRGAEARVTRVAAGTRRTAVSITLPAAGGPACPAAAPG